MSAISSVNSPHNGPVTRKMFPFDDVITKPRNVALSTSDILVIMVIAYDL